MISDCGANLGTESLLEGSVGISLPKSKINLAAQKHMPDKLKAKEMSDECENVAFSEEDDEEEDDPSTGKNEGVDET